MGQHQLDHGVATRDDQLAGREPRGSRVERDRSGPQEAATPLADRQVDRRAEKFWWNV